MEISVVPMQEAHVEGFRDCVDRVARERRYLGAVEGFPLDSTREYVRIMRSAGNPHFVAVDGADVVGWIDITPKRFEGLRHVGALGMGVLASHRRRGIGARLLRAALDAADKAGLQRIELEVFASNAPAIALYQKFGFVHEGLLLQARHLDGVHDDIVVMALLLHTPPQVRINAYDPTWPEQFQVVARGIRAALGDLAIRIDHIGSTSVKDLPAKDIIDAQVTVADLSEPAVARILAAMQNAGYRPLPRFNSDHRPPGALGPDEDWAKLFFWEPPGARRANIHVRMRGRPNHRFALLFRDYLRATPEAAEAYVRLKYALARYHAHGNAIYQEIKNPAVDLINQSAETWASATKWEPGTADA